MNSANHPQVPRCQGSNNHAQLNKNLLQCEPLTRFVILMAIFLPTSPKPIPSCLTPRCHNQPVTSIAIGSAQTHCSSPRAFCYSVTTPSCVATPLPQVSLQLGELKWVRERFPRAVNRWSGAVVGEVELQTVQAAHS